MPIADQSVPDRPSGSIGSDDLVHDLIESCFGATSLSMLRRDLRLAAPSVLGFSITVTLPGPDVSVVVNVVDEPLHPGAAADSITVPLPSRGHGSTASLSVYAAQPNALDDLRDDFADALNLQSSTLTGSRVDHGPISAGITGLEAFTEVHRAIGVLLGLGRTPQSAEMELIELAHSSPSGIHGAARALLDEIRAQVSTTPSTRLS